MKRLWVRLSAVAGVVAMLGGGGYYFVNSGTAANPGESDDAVVDAGGTGSTSTEVIPKKDELGGRAPEFDGASASLGGGYGTGQPDEPATATWSDGPSKPLIRQVSGNDPTDTYGDGGAPPADPSPAYGSPEAGAGYDPSVPADSTPGYGAPSYAISDDAAPNDPIATSSAPDDSPAGSYPATGGDGGYGAAPPVVAPSIPSPDTSQPVTAPSFATGEAIQPSAPSNEYSPDPLVDVAGPTKSGPPSSPAFDPSPSVPAVARQPAPEANDAAARETQPPAYNLTPAVAANMALVAGTPGSRDLDGRQTPSISVEKIAPPEIQVGKPATFKTLVRNPGQVTAKNVVVTDRPPQGTQLVDATPQPNQAADGSLVWQFDSLAAGEEVLISMEVMPLVEGEIGSLANVTFQAQASVRTICTKPQLLVEHSTDPKVLIGDDVVFNITISNPGSGDATGIVLEEDVPRGLTHVAGSELEYEVGTLRPGETRRLNLVLKASEAGTTQNKLRVRGDANLLAEHATQVEVIAPKLLVGMIGPRRRYLDRQVKYQVAFGNGGTAIAKNVELATYLPKGLKFVSTSGKGQYDPRDHAVYWSLDQLAPGQEGSVDLTALPIATGDQKLQIEGTADLGLSNKYEHTTVVEAITELVFTVSDTQDPIEVGSETVYEVRVVNNGSKTATNVQMAAILPAELTPLSGDGTTRVAVQGQQVLMEPIERLGPGDEAAYKIKVQGQRAGDHIIDVRLVSDEVPTPVTKQESTKVYADGL